MRNVDRLENFCFLMCSTLMENAISITFFSKGILMHKVSYAFISLFLRFSLYFLYKTNKKFWYTRELLIWKQNCRNNTFVFLKIKEKKRKLSILKLLFKMLKTLDSKILMLRVSFKKIIFFRLFNFFDWKFSLIYCLSFTYISLKALQVKCV